MIGTIITQTNKSENQDVDLGTVKGGGGVLLRVSGKVVGVSHYHEPHLPGEKTINNH